MACASMNVLEESGECSTPEEEERLQRPAKQLMHRNPTKAEDAIS
jgi:hypothetical protein